MSRGRLVDGLGFWVGFVEGDAVGWWIFAPGRSDDLVDGPGQAELGYRLFRRAWRRGYASEASRELLRYGFEDAGIERVHADTMAINAGSRATISGVAGMKLRGGGQLEALVRACVGQGVTMRVRFTVWV